MRNKTRLIGIALSTHTALMSPSQEQELQRLESSWGPSGSGEAGDAGRVGKEVDGLWDAQSGVYSEKMEEHGS